jgi:hypothetical protein
MMFGLCVSACYEFYLNSGETIMELNSYDKNRKYLFGSRRSFLGHAGIFTAASVVTGVVGSSFSSSSRRNIVQAKEVLRAQEIASRQFNYIRFRQKAFQVRVEAAQANLQIEIPPHPTNGDEERYPNENFVIPNPVEPDPNDPTKVIPYSGPPLTVGGELNKLATNYAIGRGHGGIHWRSDGAAALALGEEVAISILRDERLGYNERFNGFTFTKFDGTKITV